MISLEALSLFNRVDLFRQRCRRMRRSLERLYGPGVIGELVIKTEDGYPFLPVFTEDTLADVLARAQVRGQLVSDVEGILVGSRVIEAGDKLAPLLRRTVLAVGTPIRFA